MEATCGTRKAEFLGYSNKIAEMSNIHSMASIRKNNSCNPK